MKYKNIILHIPHSSMLFPIDENYINNDEFLFTLNNLTDKYTDEIFNVSGTNRVVFKYSRLFCDVERYNDDSEPMNKKGMGVYYTKGLNGITFRKVVESTLDVVCGEYNKHHARLVENINKCVNSGTTLLIDCHSFSPIRFKNDGVLDNISDIDLQEFDICLGYNDKHNFELVSNVKDLFESLGYKVDLNNIYKGAIDYNIDGCDTIMIEINKKLYLNKDNTTKSTDFYKIVNTIDYVINSLKE